MKLFIVALQVSLMIVATFAGGPAVTPCGTFTNIVIQLPTDVLGIIDNYLTGIANGDSRDTTIEGNIMNDAMNFIFSSDAPANFYPNLVDAIGQLGQGALNLIDGLLYCKTEVIAAVA